MTLQGNWVDFVILVVLAFYLVEGWERGFWVLIADFASFIGSLAIALRFYPAASQLLTDNFALAHSFANAIGFFLVAAVSEPALFLVGRRALKSLPQKAWKTRWNQVLGILPALANGLVLVAFVATLFVALPLRPQVKQDITNSRIGGYLVGKTVAFEKTLADVFGEAIQESLTYLTVQPESQERIELNFQAPNLVVDEASEVAMLALVNQERRARGIPELAWDPEIVLVAREHSRDMWQRQYFSHINPDGEDPADRLAGDGIEFTIAGENIALAPTVSLAHQGLMNSQGHRENILDPEFKKIGIGIIDGGVYGKMFTQNFTD